MALVAWWAGAHGWVWKAQRDGSETLIMANDLRDLLDELERRA